MKLYLLTFLLLIPTISFALSGDAIYSKYSKYIVNIISADKHGTGFFLNSNFIATNRHVVLNESADLVPKLIRIDTSDGKSITDIDFTICSRRVDLCFIKLKKMQKEITPLLTPSEFGLNGIKPGKTIYILGYPKDSKEIIITNGIISSKAQVLLGNEFENKREDFVGFNVNAAISPGSSGSPVFQDDGILLGVIVGSHPDSDAQNINFVISYDELNSVLATKDNKNNKNFIIYFFNKSK